MVVIFCRSHGLGTCTILLVSSASRSSLPGCQGPRHWSPSEGAKRHHCLCFVWRESGFHPCLLPRVRADEEWNGKGLRASDHQNFWCANPLFAPEFQAADPPNVSRSGVTLKSYARIAWAKTARNCHCQKESQSHPDLKPAPEGWAHVSGLRTVSRVNSLTSRIVACRGHALPDPWQQAVSLIFIG